MIRYARKIGKHIQIKKLSYVFQSFHERKVSIYISIFLNFSVFFIIDKYNVVIDESFVVIYCMGKQLTGHSAPV